MPVADRTMLGAQLPVYGDASPPPDEPVVGSGGRDPNNDGATLMLLIYTARRYATSLQYIRGWTGFSQERVWRAFEDLEDVGSVQVLEGDIRGLVSRWLDGRTGKNAQIFASTFLILTEAGRLSPELEAAITATRDTSRNSLRIVGANVSIREGLRQLASGLINLRLRDVPAKAAKTVAREWRIADSNEDGASRALAKLNLILCGFGAIFLASLSAFMLVFVTVGSRY